MGGWPWPALGLIVALGACDVAPTQSAPVVANATAQAASAARPLPLAVSEQYDQCVETAGGADFAMMACAETEITYTQDALAGRWRAAGIADARIDAAQRDFRSALPLLAPSDAVGGTLDRLMAVLRAMAITRARAHLLTGGAPPAVPGEADLTDAARSAWDRSRTAACALSPVRDCARAYDRLLAIEDATAVTDRSVNADSQPGSAAGLPLPTCAEVRRGALAGGALTDAFDARYPRELNDIDRVETIALTPAQIDNIVGYLACVAGRTDGDVAVAETGLTLFASKRHGAGALAALDRLARADDAARAYAGQIRGYLDRDGGNG